MTQTTAPALLVTGGSRGIGAATARLGAAAGYAVCVNYRADADAARRVVGDIEAAGGRAVAVRADVVRLFETCDDCVWRSMPPCNIVCR